MPLRDLLYIFSSIIIILLGILNKKIYLLLPLITIIHAIFNKFNTLIILIYIVVILSFFLTFMKNNSKKYVVITLSIILLIIYPLMIISLNNNYSSLNYEQAFINLHKKIKSDYVLKNYKKVDFDLLYNKYISDFKKASKENNEKLYYLSLEKYLAEYHDAHINIENLFCNKRKVEIMKEYYQNNYGFSLIKLDNGDYVAVNVKISSEAYEKGIRNGTTITKWQSKDIDLLLREKLPIITVNSPNISNKNAEEKYLGFYLSCLSTEKNTITFINDDGYAEEITLAPQKDGYEFIEDTITKFTKNNYKEDFYYQKINDNISYIRILNEKGSKKSIVKKMDNIVSYIKKDKTDKIILDLRNNHGGSNEIGSLITSYFVKNKSLYLSEGILNKQGKFIIKNKIYLNGQNKINKEVVVLINAGTMSAGEGIVYHLKQNDIKVAGITSSNGSMATVKRKVIMPENIMVSYPEVACLDENNNVLIDSDNRRNKGIMPDIKIPLDKESINEIFSGNKDYELDFLINYLKNSKLNTN